MTRRDVRRRGKMLFLACAVVGGIAAWPAIADVYYVENTKDSGEGSLRTAIEAANTHDGADTICIALSDGKSTVTLANALPTITDQVTFTSGAGATPVTGASSSSPAVYLWVDGASTSEGTSGLVVDAGGAHSIIAGLGLKNFSGDGVVVRGADTIISGNAVKLNAGYGLRVGTTGVTAQGNLIGEVGQSDKYLGNTAGGILVESAAAATATTKTLVSNNTIVGNGGFGLEVRADGTRIVSNRIGIDGDGLRGQNNLGGVWVNSAKNIAIGDAQVGDTLYGNVISGNSGYGIQITDGADVTIKNNQIGGDAQGSGDDSNGQPLGNMGNAIQVGDASRAGEAASEATIVNNVIAANHGDGIRLLKSEDTRIQGNRIGTLPDGTIFGNTGNRGDGIAIYGGSSNTMVGGTEAGLGNVICRNSGNGIRIETSGDVTGATIQGNRIGITESGISGGNSGNGIVVVSGSGNTIGDLSAGEGGTNTSDGANVIANNQSNGITIARGGDANPIRGNSIYGNAPFSDGSIYYLGIDVGSRTANVLEGDGVTSNSTAMGRSWQTHPVLGDPVYKDGLLTIYGTLDSPSAMDADWTIDFFANPGPNWNGHWEGKTYLGSIKYSENGAPFVASFALDSAFYGANPYITATATDAQGHTSEFSGNIGIISPLPSPALMSLGGLGVLAGVHVVRGRRRRVGR